MVKTLSKSDREAIAQAVAQAERQTSAELVTVIAPASDAYQGYFLLYGMILGSAIASALWWSKTVTAFPYLLAIQLAAMVLLSEAPWLRHALLRMVPKRVQHHRAARRACEEYLNISRHVPASTPIVLLYISLAERYAHILPSRLVHEQISHESWNTIIRTLIADIPSGGLRPAAIKSVSHITELLTTRFPEKG